MRRRVVCLLVIAAALGGCGKSAAVSPEWDPAAARVTAGLARRIGRVVPGACPDFALLDRVTYVGNSKLIHAPIASAAGGCTVLAENVEISAFADAKQRDQFVADRGRIICGRAKKAKASLPGLHWVVGGNWSLQPDSEGVGRRLAAALKGRYVLTPCTDAIVDWSDTDVAHVNALATGLHAAALGCGDLALLNREELVQNPHYAEAGLPGAYGRCTIGRDSNVLIASFDNTRTLLAPFLQSEEPYLCGQSKTARFVIGSDWLVTVPRGENAAAIAAALRGREIGDPCPASRP